MPLIAWQIVAVVTGRKSATKVLVPVNAQPIVVAIPRDRTIPAIKPHAHSFAVGHRPGKTHRVPRLSGIQLPAIGIVRIHAAVPRFRLPPTRVIPAPAPIIAQSIVVGVRGLWNAIFPHALANVPRIVDYRAQEPTINVIKPPVSGNAVQRPMRPRDLGLTSNGMQPSAIGPALRRVAKHLHRLLPMSVIWRRVLRFALWIAADYVPGTKAVIRQVATACVRPVRHAGQVLYLMKTLVTVMETLKIVMVSAVVAL